MTANGVFLGIRQLEDTYTSVSMAWSLGTLEKWVSRMVTVPVRATWPHPQNRATPEKHRIVATNDAYGTPPKHLMQHSKQPIKKKIKKNYTYFYSESLHCTSHMVNCTACPNPTQGIVFNLHRRIQSNGNKTWDVSTARTSSDAQMGTKFNGFHNRYFV